jgi:hypothetical protein
MTPVEEMSDEQFERYALAVLEKELGPVGMARYLRMHSTAGGDYTRDRLRWLQNLTFDEILEQSKNIQIPSADSL